MNAFTRFVDSAAGLLTSSLNSAAGLLVGPGESHEVVSSAAQELLTRMDKGDPSALQEIHERHEDASWEFYGVIVWHDGDYELRDPANHWRSSGSVPIDIAESCTRPAPLTPELPEKY